jgi:hypothetical protein
MTVDDARGQRAAMLALCREKGEDERHRILSRLVEFHRQDLAKWHLELTGRPVHVDINVIFTDSMSRKEKEKFLNEK